jgi:hypothetical protein
MANDEHVAMLKKGVDAWNECWRLENFDMRPNLMQPHRGEPPRGVPPRCAMVKIASHRRCGGFYCAPTR